MHVRWHTWEKKEMDIRVWWGDLQERGHLEDLLTDETTILIWISKE
jgi:hypothetical protein